MSDHTTTAATYRDAARLAEQRVEDLLGRMTLEEKVPLATTVTITGEPTELATRTVHLTSSSIGYRHSEGGNDL